MSDFGKIVNGVDEDFDAIISGHTHLSYNHRITVPEWVAEGRTVTKRPVVSAGQYGSTSTSLNFRIDPTTGEMLGVSQTNVPLQSGDTVFTANYPADSATAAIVTAANAKADVLGARSSGRSQVRSTGPS